MAAAIVIAIRVVLPLTILRWPIAGVLASLVVDALDVAILLSNWGQVDSPYDLTGDGLINGADIASILFAWTE